MTLMWHLLTHWGRETQICVSKLTIIGSDNGLAPGRRQPIIWTNARILFIGPLGTNFSEIIIKILTFSFKKMHLKMSSAKWRPFCLGLNELNGRHIFWPVFRWYSMYPRSAGHRQLKVRNIIKHIAVFKLRFEFVDRWIPLTKGH